MTRIVAFLKLIRWFHEIVAILPFVTLFFTINYFVKKEHLPYELDGYQFALICVCVQFLIATGCILNDLMDWKIDKINKPKTHIVNNHFKYEMVVFFFILFSLITLFISIYISLTIFIEWSWISISVYLASIAYNVYLKRSPLFGNILIAIMSGFIPLVIFYFAKESFNALNNNNIDLLVYLFAVYPFLIIIPRELSLDISDIEGDRKDGCKTLPILIGETKAKIVTQFFILLIQVLSLIGLFYFSHLTISFISIILLLIPYQIWLKKSTKRIDYIRAGRYLWFVMIIGLIGFTLSTLFTV